MSEFRSQLEDIIQTEELLFDATPGFGSVYKRFLGHAIAHPAKMNTRLTEFLVEKFTEEGDVVLDPMAGSGQTGVIAALRGRDAVCVELEEKFFGWMEKARKKVERQRTLAVKGRIRNVLGDARRLSELLKDVDVVLTSPPYATTIQKKGGNIPYKWVGKSTLTVRQYSDTEENIGNLPLGEVDAIVTSPPYSEAMSIKGGGRQKRTLAGVDKLSNEKSLEPPYSGNPENIGNLSHGNVDTVITSPPYEGSLEGTSRHTKGGIASRDTALAQTGTYATTLSKEATKQGVPVGYSSSEDNIGNLKKETYLGAMLQVYMEMCKVLKANGKAIVVIKPFIRNKKVVDLPFHTFLLLEKAGFKLVSLFKLKLENPSFWRVLYRKKYPKVPRILHEYVLVCQKLVPQG